MTARAVERTVVDEPGVGSSAGPRELPTSIVERMTLVFDAFADPRGRLTLEQIARATHLPRSTAHRIVDQLVRLQWLDHSALGYGLGRRSRELARGDGGQIELRGAAAPHLHELMLRTGLVVHLAVLDGPEVVYLDKVGGRFAAAVPSRVGGRAPAHATALGKAMLAWLDGEHVDALVGPHLGRRTPHTIGELAALHHELRRVRERKGLAFERGESFPDIACAAVAVRGADGPVAAVSVVGDARAPLERAAPVLVEAARRVRCEMFGDDAPLPPRRLRAVGRPGR
ncbi:IclR family transcriptional regulator [Nocardioides ferulae]|uniref:IclR family transcriptional regulator n=1 Tax=Nocardioides ferulae TaxID=2340821 RepID=UPI000EB0A145|nr:IclR family transcriptional regulator [Nocardioides ferulae]